MTAFRVSPTIVDYSGADLHATLNGCQVGDTILVAVAQRAATASVSAMAISGETNGVGTLLTEYAPGSGTEQKYRYGIYVVDTAGNKTVTLTVGGASSALFMVFDATLTASTPANATGTGTAPSVNFTPAAANATGFAMYGDFAGGAGTPGDSWTMETMNNPWAYTEAAYKLDLGTLATKTASAVIPGSSPWDVTVVSLSGASSGLTVNAATEVLTLTAQQAAVSRGRTIAAATEVLTLTAQQASVSRGRTINATTPALTLTAQQASVSRGRTIAAATEVLTLTAQPATINAAGRTVNATTVALTLTAQQASVSLGRTINAATEVLTLEAQAATVQLGELAQQAPRGHRLVHVPALDRRERLPPPPPRPRARAVEIERPHAAASVPIARAAVPPAARSSSARVDVRAIARDLEQGLEDVLRNIRRRH